MMVTKRGRAIYFFFQESSFCVHIARKYSFQFYSLVLKGPNVNIILKYQRSTFRVFYYYVLFLILFLQFFYKVDFLHSISHGICLTLLTIFLVLCISESCIEIRFNLNFYFHTSLWCLKRFCEGL